MKRDKAVPPDRILVIKLRAIGDVVMATPLLENLRQAYPNSHLAFLTEAPAAPVLAGNPFLDELLILDRHQALLDQMRFYQALRAKRFDLVIDLFGNPRSAWLTLLSGASRRLGFPFRGRKYCYNLRVPLPRREIHEVELHLTPLRVLDVPVSSRRLCFPLGETDRAFAMDWLQSQGVTPEERLIALNSGGGWYTKRWTLRGFAALADMLIQTRQARLLLLWGPGEQTLVEKLAALMQEYPLIAPPTTLKQMGALLSASSLLVTNDSGPMHIAAALGVPTVGIFGPTRPAAQGPYGAQHAVVVKSGLTCLGCNRTRCPNQHECMETLMAAEVLAGVDTLLRE